MQYGDYSQWYYSVYATVARKVDLEGSHHKKKKFSITFYGDGW